MKKTKVLFIIWGVIVLIIIILLTVLGFMLKGKNKDYVKLEEKLKNNAEKYATNFFLYPERGKTKKITSQELIDAGFLDNLKVDNDSCTGYVIISLDNVYNYKSYIKCSNYKTKGYEK